MCKRDLYMYKNDVLICKRDLYMYKRDFLLRVYLQRTHPSLRKHTKETWIYLKETCKYTKKDVQIHKRDFFYYVLIPRARPSLREHTKETCIYTNTKGTCRYTKETCIPHIQKETCQHTKRDVPTHQKRRASKQKRPSFFVYFSSTPTQASAYTQKRPVCIQKKRVSKQKKTCQYTKETSSSVYFSSAPTQGSSPGRARLKRSASSSSSALGRSLRFSGAPPSSLRICWCMIAAVTWSAMAAVVYYICHGSFIHVCVCMMCVTRLWL